MIKPKYYLKLCRGFGFKDVKGQIYLDWSKQLWNPEYKKRLLLKPRGTFKSSFYTVSYPIVRLLKNPNIRILISNAVESVAITFLNQIKKIILTHGLFKPGSIWQQKQIEIENPNKYTKEPNIMVVGVGTSITGLHFDLIIGDDLVCLKDYESKAYRQSTINWYNDLSNLLDEHGERLIIGTRWHQDDLYNHIIKNVNPDLPENDKYLIEIETPYVNNQVTGQTKFPQLNQAVLDSIRADIKELWFSSQYLNNPLPAETQIFKIEDFATFDIKDIPQDIPKIGYLDPALGETKKGDYCAFITIGIHQGKYYILDALVERIPPDNLIERIVSLAKVNNYKRIGIEKNYMPLLGKLIRERFIQEGLHASTIKELVSTKNKNARIESLQPFIVNGKLLFRSDWSKRYPLLIDQLIYYPVAEHDDAPDALEGCFRLAEKVGRSLRLDYSNFKM